MSFGYRGGRRLPAFAGGIGRVPAPHRLLAQLIRLSAALLVAAALLGTLRGSVCRASNFPLLQVNLLELMGNGRTVRFRPNDHGALRALRAVYASRDTPLWVVDGQPTP